MVVFFLLPLFFPVMVPADTHIDIHPKTDPFKRHEVLVIGKISTNPKKHHAALKPLAQYVVAKMGDLGIKDCRVIFANTIPQMVSFIKDKKIDWISETPYSAIAFNDQAGAKMLLRRWKKGVPQYHSVIVTQKGNGIDSLRDLAGKKIAFESPESTSAFLMPHYALIRHGLKTEELRTIGDQPGASKVGYLFSGQEINSSIWLYKGMVDAIAYSNLDWAEQDHTPEKFRKTFKIIHETTPFPRAIELVRKGLPADIVSRLKTILLNAQNDPAAKAALKKFQKTTRFDEIDPQTLESLKQMKKAVQAVKKESGN